MIQSTRLNLPGYSFGKLLPKVLNPETRMSLCRCLMLMRSKNLIEPVPLFETFFSLMKCQDKALRKFLYTHLLNDAKKIKTKLKKYKLSTVYNNLA